MLKMSTPNYQPGWPFSGLSSGQSEVDEAVRGRFDVTDTYLLPDGEYEFHVVYGPGSKEKFIDLCGALAPLGLAVWLSGSTDDAVITVKKAQPASRNSSRTPVLAALLSLLTILLFSLIELQGDQQLAPAIPGYVAFLGFGMPVVAIVMARYLTHGYAARRHIERPNDSYLVPGLPGVTAGLPTLGFVTYQRNPSLNRDRYFDLMILGPLAALAVAVVLQIAGDLTAVQSAVQLTSCQSVNSLVQVCPINPSVIQLGIDYLLSPFTPAVAVGHGLVSPLGDAATVGFMLYFVAVLPMASFDGGHLASVMWGTGRARLLTYLSVAVLLALDTNQGLFYWGVAIAVLLVGGRPLKLSFRDGLSGVSRGKPYVYLVLLLLAFLSVPIPHDIATIPLG